MINPMDLSAKTILVTGASDGIGKATTILLSQLGAKVVMVARSEEKLKATLAELEGTDHGWYSYDLKNIDGIEELIKRLVRENGAFDGFVHCAGVSSMRPLGMVNYSFLHDMMLINFYSFVEICRIICKRGNYKESASIVAISSIAGVKGAKSQTAYAASKAAIDGALRAMAKELAVKKIRINSIIPGFINTDMYKRYLERTGKEENDSIFEKYILGIGEPIDVAVGVAYLMSDFSKIVTGTGMVIDSGATA